jgi:hypothetical protein
MKLRIQASAIGIKMWRARYKAATTITEIRMVLSVDDGEFTACPPMNRATWSPSTTAERPKQSKAAGAQDQKVTNGGVTTTVGVGVLWPALLMLKGNDTLIEDLIRKSRQFQFQR